VDRDLTFSACFVINEIHAADVVSCSR